MEKRNFYYSKLLICSGLILKIIAIITMTIDHIGEGFAGIYLNNSTYDILKTIGRIAMPLFCFGIAEGVKYTHNFKRYIFKLGLVAGVISLTILLLTYIPFFETIGLSYLKEAGNIFLDLSLGAIGVYFLIKKKNYYKLFAILPLIFGILCWLGSVKYNWMPYFIRTQYNFYAIALIMGFAISDYLSRLIMSNFAIKAGFDKDFYLNTKQLRTFTNVISVMTLVVITLLNYVFEYQYGNPWLIQCYAVLAGLFILLYNGKKGYNNKWVSYSCYIYYPLHLIIIGVLVAVL